MKTVRVRFVTFILFFLFSSSSYSFQSFQYNITVWNNPAETSTVTVGYHPYATDLIDDSLGEASLPPYMPNEFTARLRLPADTSITTYMDLRYGCGQIFLYDYYLEWRDANPTVTLRGSLLPFEIYSIDIINPSNGSVIAQVQFLDSLNLEITGLTSVIVRIFYNGPLSWPNYSMIYPNGGEMFQADSIVHVSWSYDLGYPGTRELEFSTDNGLTWNYIEQYLPSNATSYDWTIPNISSNRCLLRVGNYPCVYDKVDGTFIIYQNQPPQLNSFLIPMTFISDVGDVRYLAAGVHPQATTGLDTLLGEEIFNLWPPNPAQFDGWFVLADNQPSLLDLQPGSTILIGTKYYKFKFRDTFLNYSNLIFNLVPGLTARVMFNGQNGYLDSTYSGGEVNVSIPHGVYQNLVNIWFIYDGSVPVELISFTADVHANSVLLNWSTASEKNNRGFEIQRKQIHDWQPIGFVQGNGTTTEVMNYSFTDKAKDFGTYQYRLKQIDYDGSYEYSDPVEVNILKPDKFELFQNYPNPFNPNTIISFTINKKSLVNITVYNALGEKIKELINQEIEPGVHNVSFNAENLPGGIYFYKINAGSFSETKKMIYLK